MAQARQPRPLGAVGCVDRAAGEDPDPGHEPGLLAALQQQHLERPLGVLAAAPQQHDRGRRPRRRGRPEVGLPPPVPVAAPSPTLRRRARYRDNAGSAEGARAELAADARRGGRARRAGRSGRSGRGPRGRRSATAAATARMLAGVAERVADAPGCRRSLAESGAVAGHDPHRHPREVGAVAAGARAESAARGVVAALLRAARLRPLRARIRFRRRRAARAGLDRGRWSPAQFFGRRDGRGGDVVGRLVARADFGDRREVAERVVELARSGSAARSAPRPAGSAAVGSRS